MKDSIYAGQLNRRVEFFEKITAKEDTGEAVEQLVSIGNRMVNRIDAVGSEEEDGRLIGLAVCKFQMRFDASIHVKASTLSVEDFDGIWDVVGPARLLDSRRRYMELRCRKRGED